MSRLIPKGWHLPTKAEWQQLIDYVSSQREYVCGGNSENIAKALASTEGWKSSEVPCSIGNNPSSDNATGFGALPAGYKLGIEGYHHFGTCAYFWIAKSDSACGLNYDFASAGWGNYSQHQYHHFSVRLIRDEI